MTEVCSSNLHVETVGQGRPLVLLHGWAMHSGLFAPLLQPLAQRHRVHAVDLPGHGHSEPIKPWTLDGVVHALERRFEDSPTPVDVLGWSLGGAIALAWARAQPRRIARLVLVATTPKFVADALWQHAMTDASLARFTDELRVAYRQTLLRFLSLQVQGSDEGRAVLAMMRRELFARGEPDPTVLGAALEVLRTLDLRDDVQEIGQPALVVSGDRDTLAPVGAGRWLADKLRRGRLIVIEGAAHTPFLSHRAAFTNAVLDFLRR